MKRRDDPTRNVILDRSDHRHGFPGAPQNVLGDEGCRGFTIRACHSSQLQLFCGSAIEVGANSRQCLACVCHPGKRDASMRSRILRLRNNCDSACTNRGFSEPIAIVDFPAHGDKQESGTNFARVVGDTLNIGIADD